MVKHSDLENFGTYFAEAVGNFTKRLRVDVYKVLAWEGEPIPSNTEECIEELLWLNSDIPSGIKVGSVFEHDVIPRLKKLDLID